MSPMMVLNVFALLVFESNGAFGALDRLDAWIQRSTDPAGVDGLLCSQSSNSSIPAALQPVDGIASDTQSCVLALPQDMALMYSSPVDVNAAAADSGSLESLPADAIRGALRVLSFGEDINAVHAEAWSITKGFFDARAGSNFARVVTTLNDRQTPLRWASVLPPVPILFDANTGAILLPVHSVGIRGSSIAPGLARVQWARHGNSAMRSAVFAVHEQLQDDAAAWSQVSRPDNVSPARSSMTAVFEPAALRGVLGPGSDLTALGRVSRMAALPLETEAAESLRGSTMVAMGFSYPPSLWFMRVVGTESQDQSFLDGLAEAAAPEESLQWQVNPTTVVEAAGSIDLATHSEDIDHARPAQNGSYTPVQLPTDAPLLDRMAVLEERTVAGQDQLSPLAARARCSALAPGLGLGKPSGFGPVSLYAFEGTGVDGGMRASPLVLTTLHYDEDMIWGTTGGGQAVEDVCRRAKTVLMAGHQPSDGGEWVWAAVGALDSPRGLVDMTLDASQTYLWIVDRATSSLSALSMVWVRSEAMRRLGQGAGASEADRFGGTVPQLVRSRHGAIHATVGQFGIASPQRQQTTTASDSITAYSDLLVSIAPDLSSPSGVLLAGYSQDHTSTSQSSDTASSESSLDVSIGKIRFKRSTETYELLRAAVRRDTMAADADPTLVNATATRVNYTLIIHGDYKIPVQPLGSASLPQADGVGTLLLSKAGIGLDYRSTAACGGNASVAYYTGGALTDPQCSAPTVCTGDSEEAQGPTLYEDRACRACGDGSFGVDRAAAAQFLHEQSGTPIDELPVLQPESASSPSWLEVLQEALVRWGLAEGTVSQDADDDGGGDDDDAAGSSPMLAVSATGAEIQAWADARYPLDPPASQLDRVCFPCHESCQRCDGFSRYNCTSCPFPWGLVRTQITEREIDDFTGNVIESSTGVKICTPGPKWDELTVGIGIAIPGAIMMLGLLLAGADLDSFVLVGIAFADLATDVLYTFTEEYHSETLFWASFASLAIVPVLPFLITLKGDPALVMLLPRGLEEGQTLALGKEWSDLESILGWDPFDAAFELIAGLWEGLTDSEVLFAPLGMLGEWIGEDDAFLSPAFVASSAESVADDLEGDGPCETMIVWLLAFIFLFPFFLIMGCISLALCLVGLGVQAVYMVLLVALSGAFLILLFVLVLAFLVAYRLLFALPIGMGLLRGAIGDMMGVEAWTKATSSSPWLLPFEENDSLGKFLVVLVLQPLYWALSLLALVLFLVGSVLALGLVVATGMLLYATRLLALRPVQAVWIKVWTLDLEAKIPDEADGAATAGAAVAASALLPVAFKQMLVSELVFESMPELVVQALNNQARDAWGLLAILSFVVTALIVLDAAYRYIWFLLIRGVLDGKSWGDAWTELPLFSLATTFKLAVGNQSKEDASKATSTPATNSASAPGNAPASGSSTSSPSKGKAGFSAASRV